MKFGHILNLEIIFHHIYNTGFQQIHGIGAAG